MSTTKELKKEKNSIYVTSVKNKKDSISKEIVLSKIQKEFYDQICTPGTEMQYQKLLKEYIGDGNYIPTLLDEKIDLKTIKNIQDAVQKQSAAEVLQRTQEGAGSTGSERKRVEQREQGNEPSGTSEAKTAEETQPKGTEGGEVIGITHEQLNEVIPIIDHSRAKLLYCFLISLTEMHSA